MCARPAAAAAGTGRGAILSCAGAPERPAAYADVSSEVSSYYVARRKRLLSVFNRLARRTSPRLAERYGAAAAHAILDDAREELDRVLPELAYIGGNRNVFTWVIVANAYIISLYRAMKRRGLEAEDAVAVCVEVTDDLLRRVPQAALRAFGRLAFSAPMRRLFRSQAAASQERPYAGDFVYIVREGGEDDIALVFSECAVNKMYEAMDVEELKPYCNFFDVTYSRLMGMGVDARQTIGPGCETCELRYKHGRATPLPARLEPVFDAADRSRMQSAAGEGREHGAQREVRS